MNRIAWMDSTLGFLGSVITQTGFCPSSLSGFYVLGWFLKLISVQEIRARNVCHFYPELLRWMCGVGWNGGSSAQEIVKTFHHYIKNVRARVSEACHVLRWLLGIRLQLSGVLCINNGVTFKNSHRCQILLPILFLHIFVPKFEKCCPNSH